LKKLKSIVDWLNALPEKARQERQAARARRQELKENNKKIMPSAQKQVPVSQISNTSNQTKKALPKFGILKLASTVFLLVGVWSFFGGCGPSVKIEGDVAKVHLYASPSDTPYGLAGSVCDAIWSTARKNPSVKQVEVTLEFTGKVWGDQYGTPKKGPFIMGTITYSDLDDLRKFTSKSIWADVGKLQVYGMDIRGMDYGLLLSKD
jgi:hypothetical protein